jgi:hypothetical protein
MSKADAEEGDMDGDDVDGSGDDDVVKVGIFADSDESLCEDVVVVVDQVDEPAAVVVAVMDGVTSGFIDVIMSIW